MEQGPEFPAGPVPPTAKFSETVARQLIAQMREAPQWTRRVMEGIEPQLMDVPYRNWTVRQIVHHLADSHVNSYVRFKWTLTEDEPTIKAYDEAQWVQLPDAATGDWEPPLALLEAIHARWCQSLDTMTAADFQRRFFHPESQQWVTLWDALHYYPWHARHHTAQIQWLRDRTA